jgi:hypothetical protein
LTSGLNIRQNQADFKLIQYHWHNTFASLSRLRYYRQKSQPVIPGQHVTNSPRSPGQILGPDEAPAFAPLLKTSRTQVDRLLDPKNDITLSSLECAPAMVGVSRSSWCRADLNAIGQGGHLKTHPRERNEDGAPGRFEVKKDIPVPT